MSILEKHSVHSDSPDNVLQTKITNSDAGFVEKNGENVSLDKKIDGNSDSSEGQKDLLQDSEESKYPGPIALTALMIGVFLAAIVTALDRTIVATAIPTITDDFHSPADIGWYGSAYMLTTCAFQPMYGRIYRHFDIRWSFLGALAVFELGSLVCATAPNSPALIVGRSIAGIGVAGLFSGAMLIISISMPPAKRSLFLGLIGGIFGLGSVAGPLLGGVFTDEVSWRWCFYVNLPCGGVTLVTLLLFFHPKKVESNESLWKRVLMLDLVGNVLIITTVVMLLLALQWGGTTHPWNSALIIGLFVGTGVELLLFIAWQIYKGDSALIPPKIVTQRTVAASCLQTFFMHGTLMVNSYYFPSWFQVIRGDSPIQSGVHVVPLLASCFTFTALAGVITSKTGYYNPPAIIGPPIAMIGMGLLTSLHIDASTARWASYQVIAAAGIGLTVQQGVMAAQVVLSPDQIAIGGALVLFASPLSGSIFISVCNSIIRNSFFKSLRESAIPGVDASSLLSMGVIEAIEAVPDSALKEVLQLYHNAFVNVFVLCMPLLGLALLAGLAMEWKKVEPEKVASSGPIVEDV